MSNAIDSQTNKDAIKASTDWREAAVDLIRSEISEGLSFSSGEIAAIIRVVRPELKFMVSKVGELIRDKFHDQELDQYNDDGDGYPTYPYQGLRIAQGLFPDRTPAGTEVFVYGPSQEAIDEHDFEVYIPIPGENLSDYPDPDVQAASVPAPAASQVVSDRLTKTDIKAKVWQDNRMCIPRKALEAAIYLGDGVLGVSSDVFVSQTDTEIVVVMADPNSTEFKSYKMWATSGSRIAFASTDKDNPYVPGEYNCKIEAGKITVNLKD